MKYFYLCLGFTIFICDHIYGKDEMPVQIHLEKAISGGSVNVRIQNKTNHAVRIWQHEGNSWGWSNWTFEFFNGNDLNIFVRKPDQGFTVNLAFPLEIPASDSIEISFNLSDGSWISHHIAIAPTYPSKEQEKNAVKGCFAVLAIPRSKESDEQTVWTGTVISPLY